MARRLGRAPRSRRSTSRRASTRSASSSSRSCRQTRKSSISTTASIAIRIEGPLDEKAWVPPQNYARFFPDGPPPASGPGARRLRPQGARADSPRAPSADRSTRRRSTGWSRWPRSSTTSPARRLKKASARRWSRCSRRRGSCSASKKPADTPPGKTHPLVDEYALASRLSYFLWSTMPDDELLDLAGRGRAAGQSRRPAHADAHRPALRRLRRRLHRPMAAGPRRRNDVDRCRSRPSATKRNGRRCWTSFRRSRDKSRRARGNRGRTRAENRGSREAEADPAAVEKVARRIPNKLAAEAEQEAGRRRSEQALRPNSHKFERLREKFSDDVRHAMRRETEMTFDYVMREDRSLLELIDANYTFLNQKLAKYYGIPGVEGQRNAARRAAGGQPARRRADAGHDARGHVEPDADLAREARACSCSTTSWARPPRRRPTPCRRWKPRPRRSPTIRHRSAKRSTSHRNDPLCAGCHARMDPLGLALENFNAIGMWRDTEHDRPDRYVRQTAHRRDSFRTSAT